VQDKLQDELGRLSALDRYGILDTQPEARFDKITALVRSVLNVPMAVVTLVSTDRQWLKSRQGVAISEMPRGLSFCTYTIQKREPMMIPDAIADPLFAESPIVTGAPFIRSYLGIPLSSPDGYNIGALCALDTQPREYDASQIQIMTNFAALVMDEMELRLIAQTDFLTGALTRRALIARLDHARARFAREREPAAVLMIDIDRFKAINDTLGHVAGDRVLAAVAACCSDILRAGDAIGRIGGEEFAILLGNVSADEAACLAERFRRAIASLNIPSFPALQVTASIGVSSLTPDLTSIDAWLACADAAMYAAKQSGRNRWCMAGPGLEICRSQDGANTLQS
jgi:diguanylate cyclase (GGDEF)-like protein